MCRIQKTKLTVDDMMPPHSELFLSVDDIVLPHTSSSLTIPEVAAEVAEQKEPCRKQYKSALYKIVCN